MYLTLKDLEYDSLTCLNILIYLYDNIKINKTLSRHLITLLSINNKLRKLRVTFI